MDSLHEPFAVDTTKKYFFEYESFYFSYLFKNQWLNYFIQIGGMIKSYRRIHDCDV